VTQSWQRPELAESVRTLLSLGADPNYTNGKRNSFAMANAVHGSAPVLRAMLEAGGNPNARNEFDEPMILMNWYLGYYPDQAKSRLDLLLDHGADVNSAMPASASDSAGYSLLLYRTKMGLDDKRAYADALALLERGADPNRAGADGMTFGKMLTEHRAHFERTHKEPAAEFAALWDWAEKHGIIQKAQGHQSSHERQHALEMPPSQAPGKGGTSKNYFRVISRMVLPPMISRISKRLTASWRCWSSLPTNLAPIGSVFSRRPSNAAMLGYSIMSRIS
jgi:hypothetical protein